MNNRAFRALITDTINDPDAPQAIRKAQRHTLHITMGFIRITNRLLELFRHQQSPTRRAFGSEVIRFSIAISPVHSSSSLKHSNHVMASQTSFGGSSRQWGHGLSPAQETRLAQERHNEQTSPPQSWAMTLGWWESLRCITNPQMGKKADEKTHEWLCQGIPLHCTHYDHHPQPGSEAKMLDNIEAVSPSAIHQGHCHCHLTGNGCSYTQEDGTPFCWYCQPSSHYNGRCICPCRDCDPTGSDWSDSDDESLMALPAKKKPRHQPHTSDRLSPSQGELTTKSILHRE